MIEEYSEKICEWLDGHPEFKPATMCQNIGINPSNFANYRKIKKIPAKYIPKINVVLVRYGFLQGNPVMERNGISLSPNFHKDVAEITGKMGEEYSDNGSKTIALKAPLIAERLTTTNKPQKAPKKQKKVQYTAPNTETPEKPPQNEPQGHPGVTDNAGIGKVGVFWPEDSVFGKDFSSRIAELEKEIANPPKELSPLAKKSYIYDRKKELENLKK